MKSAPCHVRNALLLLGTASAAACHCRSHRRFCYHFHGRNRDLDHRRIRDAFRCPPRIRPGSDSSVTHEKRADRFPSMCCGTNDEMTGTNGTNETRVRCFLGHDLRPFPGAVRDLALGPAIAVAPAPAPLRLCSPPIEPFPPIHHSSSTNQNRVQREADSFFWGGRWGGGDECPVTLCLCSLSCLRP
jgi:hypothetical protein